MRMVGPSQHPHRGPVVQKVPRSRHRTLLDGSPHHHHHHRYHYSDLVERSHFLPSNTRGDVSCRRTGLFVRDRWTDGGERPECLSGLSWRCDLLRVPGADTTKHVSFLLTDGMDELDNVRDASSTLRPLTRRICCLRSGCRWRWTATEVRIEVSSLRYSCGPGY